MATTKKAATSSQASKKGVIADIVSKMETAFDDLKHELGEKKFGKRLKKAAKILMHGIDADEPKPGSKKAIKKAVSKPKKKSPETKAIKNSEGNKESVKKKSSKTDVVKAIKPKVKKSAAPKKNKPVKGKLTK